jgi:hypothetical protein
MTQELMALGGGLFGSIFTVVISRVLDIIQKKKEFKYSLKKSFFERKLYIAEAAISQRYIIWSYLKSLSVLFEQVSKNIALFVTPPPEFLKNFIDGISQQIAKLSTPALDVANAASLFFDLDDSQDSTYAKNLVALMMSIDGRQRFLQGLLQYAMIQKPEEKDKTSDIISTVLKEMQAETKKLSEMIEEGSKKLSVTIYKIRKEMKKFES